MPEHTPAPTPSRAVYGFVMHLSFKLLFVLYLIWAIVPESTFRTIGITCLPQRYWAVAVPIFILTVVAIFGFIIYPSLNLYMTPKIEDLLKIQNDNLISGINSNLEEFLLNNDKNVCNTCCQNTHKCKKKEFFKRHISDNSVKHIPSARILDVTEISKELFME